MSQYLFLHGSFNKRLHTLVPSHRVVKAILSTSGGKKVEKNKITV
jgi:hypothetical protein